MISGRSLNRIFTIFVIHISLCCASFSQTIFGVNVSDPNNTLGFQYNSSNDAMGSETYLKNDPGIFDQILLIKGLGFICSIDYPTLNRFDDIYTQLIGSFGFENEMLDSIPDASINADTNEKVFLVKEGKGEILRYWYEEKFNIKLIYNRSVFKIYFSCF